MNTQRKKMQHAREKTLEAMKHDFLSTMNAGSHIFPPAELLVMVEELLVAYYWEIFGEEHQDVLGIQLPQPHFRLNVNKNWCSGWTAPQERGISDYAKSRKHATKRSVKTANRVVAAKQKR